MSVSKEDYEAAMKTTMQADKDTLTTVISIMSDLKTAIDSAVGELQATRDAIPVVVGPTSTMLNNLNNWISQVQFYDSGTNSITVTINSILGQYTVTPTPSTTSTAPTTTN